MSRDTKRKTHVPRGPFIEWDSELLYGYVNI